MAGQFEHVPDALERLDAVTEGETRFGAMDAAGLMAAIADEVIAGYFSLVEGIEREIDALDEHALKRRPRNDILARIVELRRRIGTIRRTLAPHRIAFAALARPEMELHDELGRPWPGLTDRLDRANFVGWLKTGSLTTYCLRFLGPKGNV